jgi:serine/threonine-protein kinase RsbW
MNAKDQHRNVLEIRNDRQAIDRAQSEVLAAAEALGYPKASRFAVRLALEEAISNAFRHGHRGLPEDATVRLEYSADEREIRLSVEDKGPGFRPQDVPDPTLDANLEQLSGRGMVLIRAYMAHVAHNATGNRLEMIYRRPAGA